MLRAPVRRIEPSPAFVARFGRPNVDVLTPDHSLWPVIPIGRKMTRPVPLTIPDLNGQRHECLAEAFDTTYNILILLYPVTELTATTVLMPASATPTEPPRPSNRPRDRTAPFS